MLQYARENGTVSRTEVKEAVYPNLHVEGQNERTWYRENVRPVRNESAEYESSERGPARRRMSYKNTTSSTHPERCEHPYPDAGPIPPVGERAGGRRTPPPPRGGAFRVRRARLGSCAASKRTNLLSGPTMFRPTDIMHRRI